MILWTNAKFYTLENNNSYVNNVLTNNGIIIALGLDVNKYKPDKIIDLNNSFVFPGFTESHLHLLGLGRKLSSNLLKNKTSKNKILKEIKSFYKNETLKVEMYFDIGITNIELDEISTNNYIILRHNDYHSFTVNSKVLNDLNINSTNGIILDELITPKIVKLFEDSKKDELLKYGENAIKYLISNGFTSVHTEDLSYFNSYLETIDILKQLSNLPFRINTLIHYKVLDEYIKYYPKSKYLNDIQIKLFYDGTISSKTALLKENYKHSNINGVRMFNNIEFNNLIKKIRSINKGVAIHTIGDLATEEILDTLNKYNKSDELDRLIHASLLSDKSLKLLNNIGIDIQPLFKITDKDIIKNSISHKTNIYPFDKLFKTNNYINLSSDAPVEDINPLLNISILPNINRFDLIKGYTINPSKTININKGLIKEGYLADFTCFNRDILNIKNEDLLNTKVTYTIIDEKIVYKL